MSTMLAALNVSKHFGGIAALSDCTVDLQKGLVTGLIGPNGAGKTTLLNVISGLMPPDAGRVLLDGVDITGLLLHKVAKLGVVRTFQIARELANLTVLENLLLAADSGSLEYATSALFRRRHVRASETETCERALRVLEQMNLRAKADDLASALSGGQKKLLELARALMLDPRVILLDEPAAGVAPPLVREIGGVIRKIADSGVTIGIVEHDMHLIGSLCDHVYVLAAGRTLVHGTFAEVTNDPAVVSAYLGRVA